MGESPLSCVTSKLSSAKFSCSRFKTMAALERSVTASCIGIDLDFLELVVSAKDLAAEAHEVDAVFVVSMFVVALLVVEVLLTSPFTVSEKLAEKLAFSVVELESIEDAALVSLEMMAGNIVVLAGSLKLTAVDFLLPGYDKRKFEVRLSVSLETFELSVSI